MKIKVVFTVVNSHLLVYYNLKNRVEQFKIELIKLSGEIKLNLKIQIIHINNF